MYFYMNRKIWLEKKGSPQSHINECKFTNEREILNVSFDNFHVRF